MNAQIAHVSEAVQDSEPSQVSQAEILKTLQQHGRNVEADRENLIEEVLVLAQTLRVHPERGISNAAVGGLLYAVRRLYELVEPSRRPDELAEAYASVELGSFAQTDQQVEQVRRWALNQGIVLRSVPVECPDNSTRYMFASHLRQTTIDGRAYEEGEFVHSPMRQIVPFVELLKGTPYERRSD